MAEIKWQTIKEFEAAPEEGIYFTYIKIREEGEIKIAWYENYFTKSPK